MKSSRFQGSLETEHWFHCDQFIIQLINQSINQLASIDQFFFKTLLLKEDQIMQQKMYRGPK